MANHHFKAKLVGQLLLKLLLPQPVATVIAATSIGQDEQLIFAAKARPVRVTPPLGNGISGELGGIVGSADINVALVVG